MTDQQHVDNVRVDAFTPLIAPAALKSRLALTETARQTVYDARQTIQNIIRGYDDRLLVVVGPCSIHDPAQALDYARLLHTAHQQFADHLYIVMRTYLEKPRTTVGWRGFINDPHIDNSFDMAAGVLKARELLLQINDIGLPVATELLDPISPHYFSDLIAVGAIGARTTESQTHRSLVSGISMPVGFKNSTDGNVKVAVDACVSASIPHSFLGIDAYGASSVVRTVGNPDTFVILRGSRAASNYDADTIATTTRLMQEANLHPAIMIDCSHANSRSDYRQQATVWNTVLEQYVRQHHAVIGMMVESHINEGKQSIPANLDDLAYGVSITDGCVGWQTTSQMLEHAYTSLRAGAVISS